MVKATDHLHRVRRGYRTVRIEIAYPIEPRGPHPLENRSPLAQLGRIVEDSDSPRGVTLRDNVGVVARAVYHDHDLEWLPESFEGREIALERLT